MLAATRRLLGRTVGRLVPGRLRRLRERLRALRLEDERNAAEFRRLGRYWTAPDGGRWWTDERN